MTRPKQTARRSAESRGLRTPVEVHPPAETRVAIYIRISTDEEHQPFSLEAQEHRLLAFIPTQPGWVHVATYTDQMSGAKAERPDLARAMRDARLGRFDVLLVYRVDRFARSLKVLVQLLEELEAAGVAFRSATEPIDTSTATGRMLVQLLGVFAEFERATIIDRVINGMERKAARGGWPGGPLPHGLALGDEDRLVVRPELFPVVERIFRRYDSGEVGGAAIAAELNDDGLRTRNGKPWSAKVVLDILRNRAYVGEVYFRGSWYPSADEPFIDRDLFERVQARLDERGEGYKRRYDHCHPEYLLTGLLVCDACKGRYVGASANGKKNRYRYYMCSTRQRYGPSGCSGERVRADELEAAVFAALLDVYSDPDLLRDAAASQAEASAAAVRHREDELLALDAELAKTEAAIERYMGAFENGTVTEDMFGERVRELGARAKSLRARRAEAALEIAAGTVEPPTPEQVRVVREELAQATRDAPDAVRKQVAQAFVSELRVAARDRVEPTFRVLSGLPTTPVGGETDGSDPRDRGVRTMTPTVGAEGLEPPTPCL